VPRTGAKVQTQLLIPASTRDRIAAIAIASGYTRAEILRQMVEARIPQWEARYTEKLGRLDALAERFDMTRGELAEAMVREKLTLESAEKLDSYPDLMKA
jgi:hypothetical protein